VKAFSRKRITLPRPEKDLLIEVRTGEWKLERVLAHARLLSKEVEESVASSPLPEKVNRRAISELVAQVHLAFWRRGQSE